MIRDRTVSTVKRVLLRYGYELRRPSKSTPTTHNTEWPVDFDAPTIAAVQAAEGYTMTGLENRAATVMALRYIVEHKIRGAVVECGVWRGGQMMVAARTLVELGVTDCDLYLFDTFEGMPKPTEVDVEIDGTGALAVWDEYHLGGQNRLARASMADVRRNVDSVG